ncbi:hypothetical protein D9756_005596 [Leucocoprinus leucothites]|uniref:Uncharacterized protein n=1 Tax=Leucocoprinus leucothites TaxID=201217 RepID=A0A8H5D7T3_9AGAR|nr:hypothetical protein D9756_005596 [Leucoagaricus leucothites]
MSERKPYSGSGRKLLLAFDVGTTYSGISYSILDPGLKPEIHGVHKFPGQISAGGDAKIPSIMYYDQNGRMRAAGAEAEREGIEIMAEEEGWVKTKWFKLHLRPKGLDFSSSSISLPPLPLQKTVVEVLSDFLRYLNECAKQYIQENHPGVGSDLWTGSEIHYILPHPNGWEGPQRSLMRQAAEMACLVPSGGRNQLSFVSEGEASLNRCIEKGLLNDSIRGGEGVIIVDAGGGTIDMSVYALDPKSRGKWFEEIAQPQCHLNGSITVTEEAGKYLSRALKQSKYHDDIPIIKEKFDAKAKCAFRNPDEPYYVQFGTVRDRDPSLSIQAGKLRLEGKDIATFFEPSIECIIKGVLAQESSSHQTVTSVFLVGGFSNNGYLFKRVKNTLERRGLLVSRPDTRLNKAVADGAVAGVLDRPIRSRISRNAFGVECSIIYDSMLRDHVQRKSQCIETLSGEKAIPNGFNLLLHKDTRVLETEEFRCSYTRGVWNPRELQTMEKQILCYHGSLSADKYKWIYNDSANYRVVCTVKADLTGISIPRCINPKGQAYYKVSLDVILLFGATELKAKIAWKENGKERRRDAEVIYETEDLDSFQDVEGSRLFSESFNTNVPSNAAGPNQVSTTEDERIRDTSPLSWVTVISKKKRKDKKKPAHDESKPREKPAHDENKPKRKPARLNKSPSAAEPDLESDSEAGNWDAWAKGWDAGAGWY